MLSRFSYKCRISRSQLSLSVCKKTYHDKRFYSSNIVVRPYIFVCATGSDSTNKSTGKKKPTPQKKVTQKKKKKKTDQEEEKVKNLATDNSSVKLRRLDPDQIKLFNSVEVNVEDIVRIIAKQYRDIIDMVEQDKYESWLQSSKLNDSTNYVERMEQKKIVDQGLAKQEDAIIDYNFEYDTEARNNPKDLGYDVDWYGTFAGNPSDEIDEEAYVRQLSNQTQVGKQGSQQSDVEIENNEDSTSSSIDSDNDDEVPYGGEKQSFEWNFNHSEDVYIYDREEYLRDNKFDEIKQEVDALKEEDVLVWELDQSQDVQE